MSSVSKSISAILLGIAIDKDLVAGTDETLFSYFPDYEHLNDSNKRQIQLEHILPIGFGLPWTEAYSYEDSRNYLAGMIYSEDPIAYILMKTSAAQDVFDSFSQEA